MAEKKTKKEIIEELRISNPYPEDIFTPMTGEELRKVRKMFKDNNLVIDKFSAHCMRIAWNLCVDEVELCFSLMDVKK